MVRELVGRDVPSITCRIFMACICLSPATNGDSGAVLLSASARSSTSLRAASVEKLFGTRQLCEKNSTVLTIIYTRVAGT